MVDLTRDEHGKTRARLLNLVTGRSRKAYATWLGEHGPAFRAGVQVAALDPFADYQTAIDDTAAVCSTTPSDLGAARPTALRDHGHPPRRRREPHRDAARARFVAAINAYLPRTRKCSSRGKPRNNCDPRTRPNTSDRAQGSARLRRGAAHRGESPPSASRPARSARSRGSAAPSAAGETHSWRTSPPPFSCNNGGIEAINGIIELHCRLDRGYRNRHNYRLRMLLAAEGLAP